jgi:hypothetical protein
MTSEYNVDLPINAREKLHPSPLPAVEAAWARQALLVAGEVVVAGTVGHA